MILLLAQALAAEMVVVAEGDTLEAIALGLGDPALVEPIRATNGLAPGEVPVPGTILALPALAGLREHGAVVLVLQGQGTATAPGQPSRRLEAGMDLPPGSLLCTDPASYATVRLAVADTGRAHDDVTLLGATCLTVDAAASRPGGVRRSLVSVERGSVSVRAAPGTPGVVAVRTASGVTAGVGGAFRVHVEPGAARSEAVYAPVSVFGAGAELRLAAGEGSRVRKGEAPSPPVRLLRGETLLSPAEAADLRVAEFSWRPVPESFGYRVEIAQSEDFAELVVVEDVAVARWFPERLLLPFRVPGVYWRVSPYDGLGFLGVPSEPRSLVFPEGVGP